MSQHLPRIRPAWGRRTVAVVAAALLGLAAARCGGSDQPIRIGLAGPFSEARGRSMLAAANLAVKEINAAGGIDGRTLELVVRDDSAMASKAIAIAQFFRDSSDVVAVVGHLTSGTTIAAADIYNSGARPVVEISPSASNPDLTGIGSYTFRVCATDLAHGTALARYAAQRLQALEAAIIYLNDDYGRGILGTFTEEFTRLGGTITERDPVLSGTTDLGPFLDRIRADGRARVLMVAGDRAVGTAVLRQARARGILLPLLGGDGLSGIQGEGALAEGVHITSNYLPEQPGPRNAEFLEAYARENDGAQPDHRGAGAYDAIQLLADAVRRGGTDRAAVRQALAEVDGTRRPAWDGVTGSIAFDEQGDVKDKSVLVGVVRGGRLVLAGDR